MAAHDDPRLSQFRRELLPMIVQRLAPERVIAFGSRARGQALRSSDLDLLVVTAAFDGVPWLDRSVIVQDLIGAPFAMDILCYTPEEFDRKLDEIGVVRTAVHEGVELYRAA
jgi:uncharacterized protein